jgi:hypothetical protein
MGGENKLVEAVAAELSELGGDEQIDLFAEPETESGRAKVVNFRRGPGRPPGAKNKLQERTLAWLRAKYPDPRERMLAVVAANVADLAALWGCTVFEAVQEQRLAAGVVLPFVAQKQPLSVDLNSKTAVYLTIVEGDQHRDTGITLDVMPQTLSIAEIRELDAAKDVEPEAPENDD